MQAEPQPASEPEPAPDTDGVELHDDRPEAWIKRWKPEHNMGELGVFAGVLFPSEEHELYMPQAGNRGHQLLNVAAPDFGARLGYYPASFLGIEAEFALMPTSLRDADESALLWRGGGSLVLQLPVASITPFVLAGGGAIGINSDDAALGNDIDGSVHFGGGLKFFLNRYSALRIEVRDIVTPDLGVPNTLAAHNIEALVGYSVTLGRAKPQPKPPADTDGDGIIDRDDACVQDPETVNGFQDEDGCPESDRDGDGFYDDPAQDECPDVPGVAPNGCPSDRDGDGILDADDRCPDEPETRNGFQDADGCPDELPAPVKKYSGDIDGIRFEFNSATLTAASTPVLDAAVAVLEEYPDINIEVVGHTDNVGGAEINLELGRARAVAVQDYLTSKGIATTRITTRSAGLTEPKASNDTEEGRSINRRIEFRIISR